MTYGKSKERDMVRSILPSTSRKGARDNKRNVNRRRRSSVRQALRQHRDVLAEERFFDHEEFGWDSYDECFDFDAPYDKIHDADCDYESRIRYVMWDRREADKVAPIVRWAEAKVADIRPEDRLSWLQARMPDNLAVRHAISHIEFSDAFPRRNPYEYYWLSRYSMTDEEREWERVARYAQLIEDLYVVVTGPLAHFNDALPRAERRTYYYRWRRQPLGSPWEKVVPPCYVSESGGEIWELKLKRLEGHHDVENWVEWMFANLGYNAARTIQEALRATVKASSSGYWTREQRERLLY